MTSQDLDELGRLAEDMTFLGGYEQDLGRGVIDLIADYRKAQECIMRARLNADAGLFANVCHILTNYTEGADSHV